MPSTLSDRYCPRPRRKIQGISAVLLPFDATGRIDEDGFRAHLRRTLKAGLRPAVNMDTGYVDLLSSGDKKRVLHLTAEILAGRDWFAAGALPVSPETSVSRLGVEYAKECNLILEAGGVPVIFPSPGYGDMDEDSLISLFKQIASNVKRFIAFELGKMFNVNGRMFSEKIIAALMDLPQCFGLKHSSLNRNLEIERVSLRDRVRPDFIVYTGNDLAGDMVEYGSDYLLGLSTFCPELFAARDAAWLNGDTRYLELRDWIQYLGWIGFRKPVPAYKHSAAIFLKLTGGLNCDEPHPQAPRREAWDRQMLADAAKRLAEFLSLSGKSTVEEA